MATATHRSSTASPAPPPVLRETPYEQVSSGLMAMLGVIAAIVLLLSFAWYASREPKRVMAVPVELVEMTGGAEDGVVGETLRVDSPFPEADEASSPDVASDEREVMSALDQVLTLSGEATEQIEKTFDLGVQNTGKPGSARGTGRRPLGSGPGNAGGFPREQRWFVRFGDTSSADEYARQLDYFGIELGALVAGKIMYVSNLSNPQPTVRTATSGSGETRLYMTWQGGQRKQADLQLLRKARVDLGSGTIFHFYPKRTEDQLAQLEVNYRRRRVQEIRRTYFSVKSVSGGYEFEVVRQTFLK